MSQTRAQLTDPSASRSASIANPGSSEKLVLTFFPTAQQVTQIRSLVLGTTPSVTFSIRYGTDVSAAGTEVVTSGITCTNETTGLSTTTFNNASIPANNFVWLTTSAASGTVNSLNVTVIF